MRERERERVSDCLASVNAFRKIQTSRVLISSTLCLMRQRTLACTGEKIRGKQRASYERSMITLVFEGQRFCYSCSRGMPWFRWYLWYQTATRTCDAPTLSNMEYVQSLDTIVKMQYEANCRQQRRPPHGAATETIAPTQRPGEARRRGSLGGRAAVSHPLLPSDVR
jgi:hypothetical protein